MIKVVIEGGPGPGLGAVATVIAAALRDVRFDVTVDAGDAPKKIADAKLIARGLRDRFVVVSTEQNNG